MTEHLFDLCFVSLAVTVFCVWRRSIGAGSSIMSAVKKKVKNKKSIGNRLCNGKNVAVILVMTGLWKQEIKTVPLQFSLRLNGTFKLPSDCAGRDLFCTQTLS